MGKTLFDDEVLDMQKERIVHTISIFTLLLGGAQTTETLYNARRSKFPKNIRKIILS